MSEDSTIDMDSPKAMAEAAYAFAVAQMERQDSTKRERDDGSGVGSSGSKPIGNDAPIGGGGEDDNEEVLFLSRPKKSSRLNDESTNYSNHNQSTEIENAVTSSHIENVWKSFNDTEANFDETLRLLLCELDSLVQCGLGAFHDLDTTSRQLTQAKELVETRSREAQRLHTIDEQSRASLSNLLRAVESSKAEARGSSHAAQKEARLRAEIKALRDEVDKSQKETTDYRRKLSLHEEELRLIKCKLSRAMQEKLTMERDSRAAVSFARSIDSSNSNDMNYYKRKVGELSDKLQSAQDFIAKQTNQIAELREQRDRDLTQNSLSQIRGGDGWGGKK